MEERSDRFTRENDKRFTLRINKDLFAKIQDEAFREKRAIGRQIEYILEKHFEEQSKKGKK